MFVVKYTRKSSGVWYAYPISTKVLGSKVLGTRFLKPSAGFSLKYARYISTKIRNNRNTLKSVNILYVRDKI